MILWMNLAFAGPTFDLLRQTDPISCASLGTPTPALREELITLTTPTAGPSMVPVRAAACLIHQFPDDPVVLDVALTWMTDPTRAGLALAALGQLDALAPASALRLATAALLDPDPVRHARVVRTLKRRTLPEVRRLVER